MTVLQRAALSSLFLVALVAGCEASSALLGPEALQGIEGQALLGPMCPVQQADGSCPDQPYQSWLTIMDASGGEVTRLQSGTDGRFRVGLQPGTYVVHPDSGNPLPRAGDQTVKVVAGVYTTVTVSFDTGIR
jgi:hypothetical protein